MVKDYYQILKLKRNASNAEINKAYHQQQKAWSNYLNTADPKGCLKAKQMLKELAMAKTALLKTKGY
jgi:curved DNA-binding protein CbpA